MLTKEDGMPVTRWRVLHDGQEWGADGTTIDPPELAEAINEIAGTRQVTYYGKPYTPDPSDAQSVYDFFDSEVNPEGGNRKTLIWDYVTSPDEAAAAARGVVF
jgi:hypothetical protein